MAVPIITTFTPAIAAAGQYVTISGSGFTGATDVLFGGVSALLFVVDDDQHIRAWKNITGTGTITVETPSGSSTVSGFTEIQVKISMPQSPALGRNVNGDDLVWVWDNQRAMLTQTPASALPAGSGGGGTGGVTTVLGSPFKVRNGDDNLEYNAPDSVIIDPRLLGKLDYVVSSTGVNSEFETFVSPIESDGSTTAADGMYTGISPLNIGGFGTGSTWNVEILNGLCLSAEKVNAGTGYNVNDTFDFAELPGITFTIITLDFGSGNLIFNDVEGSVRIKNFQLAAGRHFTVYADGVVTGSLTQYLASIEAKMALYDKIVAPVIYQPGGAGTPYKGVVWPWRRPAIEIPDGWQECIDFQGKLLIGQDPNDVYDPTTNPNGLNQTVGTPVGTKTYTLVPRDIPELQTTLDFAHTSGSAVNAYATSRVGSKGALAVNPPVAGQPQTSLLMTGPVKIVNWIEFIG